MNPIYTAAHLAAPLNVTRRAVQLRLAGTPHAAVVKARGQDTRAWAIASLPQSLRDELAAAADLRGCRDIHHLLTLEERDRPQPWTPPIPFNDVAECYQANALKLCTALAPALARQNQIPRPELMDLARSGYSKTFGHEIKADKLIALMDRATERDNSFNQWQRPDLYVDEAAYRASSSTAPVNAPVIPDEFTTAVGRVKDKINPSPYDRAYVFDAAYCELKKITDATQNRSFKQSLIEHLFRHVPGLHNPQAASDNAGAGAPLESLRRQFNRLYKQWNENGQNIDAILDRRGNASGRKAKPVDPSDHKLLVDNIVALDGRAAPAIARLTQIGALSEQFREDYPFDPQNKSHVSPALLKQIMPDVLSALPSRRGPRHTRMVGPKAARDWTAVAPYDWLSLDDVTFNIPFAVRTITGAVRCVRGECILDCLTRIGYVPHYTLIAGAVDGEKTSFNAWHVRGNLLALHDKIGLPHRGLDLEHNVFAARLIRGEQRPHWREADPRSFETGLRHAELDLQLHYHRPGTPWSKSIERIIGIIEDRMDCEPGYVGRNERLDTREHAQKAVRAVESGKMTPEDAGILWFGQFARLLDAVIREYNQEVQNGEMLLDTCGRYLSPEDAFVNGICGHPGSKSRPARMLTAAGRARLSTHQRKMYVGDAGLNIEIDRRRYPFFDENLEPYRHREVIAYLNIEVPEVLVCSDLKQEHFFPVKLQRYEARGASSENLESMNRSKSQFMARSKIIQSSVTPPIISVVARDKSITAATEELGETVNAAVAQHKEDQAGAALEQNNRSNKGKAWEKKAWAAIEAMKQEKT